MRIRMRATGQVEDFAEAFARQAVASGIAEAIDAPAKNEQKPGMPVFTAPETAATQPPETAMLGRPLFVRGPRSR